MFKLVGRRVPQLPWRGSSQTRIRAMPALRILCLHGYLQNTEIFRSRMGSWRKALKSRIEFIFMEAPHVVYDADDATAAAAGGRPGGRSWWLWDDTQDTARPSKAKQYTEWDVSLTTIADALKEHSPVDGILGFSQGATIIALFLAQCRLQQSEHDYLPKFAIFVGGFMPRDARVADRITEGQPSIPSLHIYGKNDDLVEGERSLDLMSRFRDCLVLSYSHEGAHMMPTCSGSTKSAVCDFLDQVQ